MSADFRFHGVVWRAGLAWEQAPASEAGAVWLGGAVRHHQARALIRRAGGLGGGASGQPSAVPLVTAGFDPLPTGKPALLAALCRHLALAPRDSVIVLLGEDAPASSPPPHGPAALPAGDAAVRHALLVVADGALIPGGSDLVFADYPSALAHVERLAADRDWPRILFDARIDALAARLLPARWPWSLVLERLALATAPLAVTPRPVTGDVGLLAWRRALDAALGGHGKAISLALDSGRVGFTASDPLDRLAARLRGVPNLELTAAARTASGWRIDGRRVTARGGSETAAAGRMSPSVPPESRSQGGWR